MKRSTITDAMREAMAEIGDPIGDPPVVGAKVDLEQHFDVTPGTYTWDDDEDDYEPPAPKALMKCSACTAVHDERVECACGQRPIHGPARLPMTQVWSSSVVGSWGVSFSTAVMHATILGSRVPGQDLYGQIAGKRSDLIIHDDVADALPIFVPTVGRAHKLDWGAIIQDVEATRADRG